MSALIPTVLQPYSRYIRLHDDLIWYVVYGSNLSYERTMAYIAGGRCRFNGRSYPGCSNITPPLATRDFTIPYELYLGNSSSSWNGCGACLDGTAVARPASCVISFIGHVHPPL